MLTACLRRAYGVLTLRLRTRHNRALGVTHSALLRLAQAALQEGRNGLIADRYESVAARSPTKLGGIIEGTRAVMENKVRTPGGQIYTLPERWQIEPR